MSICNNLGKENSTFSARFCFDRLISKFEISNVYNLTMNCIPYFYSRCNIFVNFFFKNNVRRFAAYFGYGTISIVAPAIYEKDFFKNTEVIKFLDYLYPTIQMKQLNNENFFTDEYIYVFGKKMPIITSERGKYMKSQFYVKDMNNIEASIDKIFKDYLIQRTKEVMEIYKLNPEDFPNFRVTISYYLSKYASTCPKRGTFQYDRRLFFFSKHVIDSVIFHEVTHLYFTGHGVGFKTLLYSKFGKDEYLRCEKALLTGEFDYGI